VREARGGPAAATKANFDGVQVPVMMIAFIGAIVIGLSLGLMGSGGSILTVPVLIYVLGHADKPAIAESLAIVGGVACVGAVPGVLARRVDWRSVVLFGVPAMAGTWLGAWVSLWIPGAVQLLVFAIVMLLAAGLMMRRGGTHEISPPLHRPDPLLIVIEGLGVGVLTGLVGVGGGFLIVPALVLLGGLGMHRAVATSLVIIVGKSAAGFWKYVVVLNELDLQVDWGTIAMFIGIGGLGAVVGTRLAGSIDQQRLKRAFGVFLIAMGVIIGVREVMRLSHGEYGGPMTKKSETIKAPAPPEF